MTILCMRIAFWVPKATNTLSICAVLIAFHCSSGCMYMLHCYIILTLPRLFVLLLYINCILVIRHCGDCLGDDQNMLVKTLTDIAGIRLMALSLNHLALEFFFNF
jgi:hypothetical protein